MRISKPLKLMIVSVGLMFIIHSRENIIHGLNKSVLLNSVCQFETSKLISIKQYTSRVISPVFEKYSMKRILLKNN